MSGHILMFCPQFRPCIGGAERQAEKLAQALVRAGVSVTLLTPRLDPDSPAVESVEGVRIERFPLIDLARRYPLPGIAVVNLPYILWQVYRAVRPRLAGCICLHTYLASLQTVGAALAARLAGVPVLCKAAVADQRSDLGEIEKTGWSGGLVAWLARRTIDTWVATTGAVADALGRAGVPPARIERIPNGVDYPAIPPMRPPAAARRFLYLGRLSTNTQRDVPTLIAAFDRLAQTYPEVELALVGGGDLLESTRGLAALCAARHRIHLPGFADPEPWLAWADVFVLPSRKEGLSNALLEAMAAGLACIANDIPPNREVLADGAAGVLVPVGDVDRLYASLQRMVTEVGHCQAMRAAALTRVRAAYGIDIVAAQYVALYQRLRSIRRPAPPAA